MFEAVMKDINSYLGCSSELVSKLHDFIWLYSSLMGIDRKMEVVKFGFKKYFEDKLGKEID